MKTKRNRAIAIGLCGFLLLSGATTVLGANDSPFEGSYLRAIKANYLEEKTGEVSADSLEPNSKWREEPLKSELKEALENDLTDTSECEQVWEFSAEEIMGTDDEPGVKEWCLENPKGTDTNNAFLHKYDANRIQHTTY